MQRMYLEDKKVLYLKKPAHSTFFLKATITPKIV